jgi:hypothetical protein
MNGAATGATASLLWWVGLALTGLAVGVVSGLFGVGGGFLMTPLLTVVFRLPMPVAVGTGLCQMIGVAMSALLRHHKLGQGEIKIDWLMMAGSLLGVGLGADAVNALDVMGAVMLRPGGPPVPWAKVGLSLGYVVLLVGIAFWMGRDLAQRRAGEEDAPPPGPLTRVPWPPYTLLPRTGRRISAPLVGYLGLLMGFLSGLLGIGGGVALMPILLYGIGMPLRTAAGTGVLVLLVTCMAGTVAHAQAGHVLLGVALVLLAGSGAGAQIGATLTARLDARRLRGYFVYIVALTAVAVLWNLVKDA